MTESEADQVTNWIAEAWESGYGAAMQWAVRATTGYIEAPPTNPYRMEDSDDA